MNLDAESLAATPAILVGVLGLLEESPAATIGPFTWNILSAPASSVILITELVAVIIFGSLSIANCSSFVESLKRELNMFLN